MRWTAALFALALFVIILLALSGQLFWNVRPSTGDCVVLLHGLGRTSVSMRPLEDRLTDHGFRVFNIGYPSTSLPVDRLAERVGEEIERCCGEGCGRLHFVTHSMGGIVLWYRLQEHRPENLARVVMLSPPSRGSELADYMKDRAIYRMTTGPAGQQMVTGPGGITVELRPVEFELGVIAGNETLNPFYSGIIRGEDDGKVSVDEARAEGMADFLVVPRSHTFIMNDGEVAGQVIEFLDNGRFRRD
jgi:pimeloyl-ACP methyl ester carboxylesterase